MRIIKPLLDNTAYTAHSVRPNFGYAETSYMLGTLYAITEEERLMAQRKNQYPSKESMRSVHKSKI